MSTIAEISAAKIAAGYRAVGEHKCLNTGCTNLLDHVAINLGFPGCMVRCRACIERDLKGLKIEDAVARAKPRQYPTSGRITADDPSIYGSEVLGHEGETWASFSRRHQPRISAEVAEPYRRGIGQGFGPTEDGQE